MCGICGYVSKTISRGVGEKMVATMKHRGPDNQSVATYEACSCLLGHARLSVIDLSAAANQPMNHDGYSIVYNGEVYNFREIRQQLEDKGHRFAHDSDTEVVLHAYEEWGQKCVDRFIGMFAFSILDQRKKQLFIARDRAGVKPLYYYQRNETFMFASEMKAFYPHPQFQKTIDEAAVALYFKFGYVPAPLAIFKHTHKLMPGHCMTYDISTRRITTHQYWNALECYKKTQQPIDYEEARQQLEALLSSAFEYRMVADVPVGIFLSGGFDSALLTAMLQKERTSRLKTFTVGFENKDWDETPTAERVAQMLGTDHTSYICTQEDCQRLIPEIPRFYDEPFADNSAVPTMLVSRLARKHVTVALSADGGDETFCGYNRYDGVAKVAGALRPLGLLSCRPVARAVKGMSMLAPKYSFLREKIEYMSQMLCTPPELRLSLIAEGGAFSTLVQSVQEEISPLVYPKGGYLLDQRDFSDPLSVAMAMDYTNYLPDDILVKVDRATMSVSLEGRDPLLDHRILEFAASLPIQYKYHDGVKKRIYKDILYKYIPKEIISNQKKGFMMPVEKWLRNELRYLLDEHIAPQKLDTRFFHAANVMKMKQLFLDDKLRHENKVIWRILMFQMWVSSNAS